MRQLCDVLVVGGGIVGLTAAIAMSQRGASVVLLDTGDMTADTQSLDSRVYAINQASKTLVRDIGVWDSLDKTRISAYEHIRVWDALSQAVIEFDARMISSDCLGTMIEQSVIKEALLQRALTENITFYPHCSIERIESIAQGLCLYGAGQCWQTSLLMVADGAFSYNHLALSSKSNRYHGNDGKAASKNSVSSVSQRGAFGLFTVGECPSIVYCLVNNGGARRITNDLVRRRFFKSTHPCLFSNLRRLSYDRSPYNISFGYAARCAL